jgi:hypothetical protein
MTQPTTNSKGELNGANISIGQSDNELYVLKGAATETFNAAFIATDYNDFNNPTTRKPMTHTKIRRKRRGMKPETRFSRKLE